MLSQAQGYKFLSKAWGEAVVIDLGELGLIVGALYLVAEGRSFSPGGEQSIVGPMVNQGLLGPDRVPTSELYERAQRLEGEIPWSTPVLLYVDPSRTRENVKQLVEVVPEGAYSIYNTTFRKAFGGNSSLIGATLQMVSDEPARQIERFLPWITPMIGGLESDGVQAGRSFARNLNAHNFVVWGKVG